MWGTGRAAGEAKVAGGSGVDPKPPPPRGDVRATRTSLLRAVRTRGAGQLGPGEALPWHYRGTTVRTAYRVVHTPGTTRFLIP